MFSKGRVLSLLAVGGALLAVPPLYERGDQKLAINRTGIFDAIANALENLGDRGDGPRIAYNICLTAIDSNLPVTMNIPIGEKVAYLTGHSIEPAARLVEQILNSPEAQTVIPRNIVIAATISKVASPASVITVKSDGFRNASAAKKYATSRANSDIRQR